MDVMSPVLSWTRFPSRVFRRSLQGSIITTSNLECHSKAAAVPKDNSSGRRILNSLQSVTTALWRWNPPGNQSSCGRATGREKEQSIRLNSVLIQRPTSPREPPVAGGPPNCVIGSIGRNVCNIGNVWSNVLTSPVDNILSKRLCWK